MIKPVPSVTAPIISPVLGERPRTPQHPMRRFFRNNEVGVWYDPSDLNTLFQDSAGTIPVTGPEQPVGLMLDKTGNGHHAWQDAAASKPVLRESGGLYWLECDGVDDFMQTAPIPWASDKMLAVVGVRKMSDANTALITELSQDVNNNDGSFFIAAPISPDVPSYHVASRGSLVSGAGVQLQEFAAPSSNVITLKSDIASDELVLRLDGAERISSGADQGTGTFGNHPLYLFSRGGTSLFFNGHFYGMTLAAGQYAPALIDAAERYLASKMRAPV